MFALSTVFIFRGYFRELSEKDMIIGVLANAHARGGFDFF